MTKYSREIWLRDRVGHISLCYEVESALELIALTVKA